ncbi:MAG: alpha-ketoacid dehydrogenase subunit beta [Candidatus Kariarchaeaceae archaeon]|jgi:2-oxoisovalerate dehydrogenase E1 component beta subunit
MVEMNILEAVRDAMDVMLAKDETVYLMGEDIGPNGGVFRATEGLQAKHGVNRVLDTPLNESGIIGFAIGMGLRGAKAVPEIQFIDFIFPAFDQIVSELAKFRYRSGGQFTANVTIRSPYGGGVRGAHYHSQSPEALFAHTPGLKVVVPSNPYDAKGLLIASIQDPDPVIFMEPKRIYRAFKEDVPEGEYTVPIGKAEVVREGTDVTLISYGAMLHVAVEAAQIAAQEDGINCEVIDLKTVYPLDIDTIEKSVKKTGRVISVTESPKTAGFGAEISALIAERYIEYMEAPIIRVTGYDVPFPFVLEHDYMPTADRVLDAIDRVWNY